ncbi:MULTISPECIES: hypothetical protein, partial [unclassified Mycobacterium]|uniref:hypothetical protein n=1 Tax=unclassified Mycobacterium TaxID=2642494 RepID=UPI001CD9FBAD
RYMEPAQLGQPSRGHSLHQAIANRVMEVADRPTDGQPLPLSPCFGRLSSCGSPAKASAATICEVILPAS